MPTGGGGGATAASSGGAAGNSSGSPTGTLPPEAGLYSRYDDQLNDYLYLEAGGRFYDGKPEWRPDQTFDIDASIAAHPYRGGTYTRSGNQLLITWTTDRTTRMGTLQPNSFGEEALQLPEGTFVKAKPSSVTTLSGRFKSRYVYMAGDPTDPNSTTTTIDKEVNIVFSPSGSFTIDAEALITLARVHRSELVSFTGNSSSGTYKIDGLFLTLTFSDNSTVQDVFVPLRNDRGRDPNDDGFDFGERIFIKQ